MRSLSLLALTLILVIAPSSYAQRERDTFTSVQPLEVSGQVRIVDQREPAKNVTVRLERFSGGIVEQMNTDSQGRFRFSNLQRGYYTVVIESPGYQVSRQTADLQIVFKAFLLFELQPDAITRIGPGVIDVRVPAAARDEYSRAVAELEDKRTQRAIPYLERAISIYPAYFDAHILLASSLMDLRRWKDAEAPLKRAIEIKPDSSRAYISLGEVNWRLSRLSEAENQLLRGLKLDDRNWLGHFTLARVYWDRGEIIKAGVGVGRTLQLKPDFAEAHLLAGNVFLRLGHQDRAIVEYEEYLKLAPKGEFAAPTSALLKKLKNPSLDQTP